MGSMKLTAQIKLLPTPEQAELLRQTLERANAACDAISGYAWDNQHFSQYGLHEVLYKPMRDAFALAAQMVVRCLAKVADSYATNCQDLHTFQPHGSIAYDARILSYRTDRQEVSIWTLDGRQTIAYQAGERQHVLLKYQQGETDLTFRHGAFYLLATCAVPTEQPEPVSDYLGIDRGVINIATDSDGNLYQGQRVEQRRKRYSKLRRALQKKGTKSAKRHLRKLRGKQARFQKDVNHCTAKELVKSAKRTKRGIAVEKLTGITLRTRVRREDRAERGNGSFDQLGQYLDYKAALYGVAFREVDPRYTSQRCAACGHTDRANRLSQAEFLCQSCGHAAHADVNAARNIAWVAVNQPIVSSKQKTA
jgi:IS605 OrfB family transposase